MDKSLALYEPNYDTVSGTKEFWLNQQKYVRLCCYVTSGKLEMLYVDWNWLVYCYLTDFGYKNYARQYYFKVLCQAPRTVFSKLTPKY